MLSLVMLAKIVSPLKDPGTKKNPVIALEQNGADYAIRVAVPDDSAPNQVWFVELSCSPGPAGLLRPQYQFSMIVGDKELALAAGPARQSVPVVEYKPGDPNQLWTAVNSWDNGRTLRFGLFNTPEDQVPDRVLDLRHQITTAGTPLLLWPPASADLPRNQQWGLKEVSSPDDGDVAPRATAPQAGKYRVEVSGNPTGIARSFDKLQTFPSLSWSRYR